MGVLTIDRRAQNSLRAISMTVALLLLSACQSATDSTVPGSGPTSAPQTTTPSQSTQPSTVTGEVELGPGDFDLVDPGTGLDLLSSYQQTLVVTFEGAKDGQPHQWSKTYTFAHAQEPLASVLTITGDIDTDDPVAVAQSAGALYQSHSDGSCIGEPLDPENPHLTEPVAQLSGLLGAEEAGIETANGIESLHYTFDERALAESGRTETDGELWLATEDGPVMKYVRTTTADATYFGENVEGTITWAYDLTGIDQTQVTLPPGCQLDVPPMSDAVNLVVLPEWMGYETQSSAADVTAFYQGQLPGRGWAQSGDPIVGEGVVVSLYTRGDQTLNVLVIAGESATQVDIVVTPSAG
jgi:hypothetical protein